MIRFLRQREPAFWAGFERKWLHEAEPHVRPLHDWQRDGRTLAVWFHAEVRSRAEPCSCSYCDGLLRVESAETIDHFVPQTKCRQLGLTWDNLYPACTWCNSIEKRTKGSCWLLRPDVDPVEEWIEYDPQTGRLEPAPNVIDRVTLLRIRRTLRVLGLNTTERTEIRRRHYRMLGIAWRSGDNEHVVEVVKNGPYRFIARKFLASKKPVNVLV